MKRTIIEAEDLNDSRVMVIGFQNAATAAEIKREFGPRTLELYRQSEWRYINKIGGGTILILWRKNAIKQEVYCTINEGTIFSKKCFGEVISKMKACGENLMKARKQAAKEEMKRGKKRRIIRIEI